MVRTSLAPGFRFHPTDDELILYYLKRKIMGRKFHYEAIAEVNIYKHSPWDLPDKSLLKTKDLEWYFFCPREKKYASGVRVKRATKNGYWKTTGKDRTISCNKKTVGSVKTLIFHLGHAPQGERTNWVIHEYRILDEQLAKAGLQDNYVLCKVFEKKGLGPKNGAQYGAPFNEADWADDDDDVDGAQNNAIPLVVDGPSPAVLMQNQEQHLPLGAGLLASGNELLPLPEEGTPSSVVVPTSMIVADETIDDEMTHLLDLFGDEDMVLSNGNGLNQDGNGKEKCAPVEGLDLYDGLDDLEFWTGMKEDIFDFSGVQNVDDSLTGFVPKDNSSYIELDDLLRPLDCTNKVTGTHLSSLYQASASHSHENSQQLYSDTRFSGLNQYNNTSYANDLVMPPYTLEGGDSLAMLQMSDHQLYQGYNASYNLDLPIGQLEGTVYAPHNMMERGSHLENRYMEFDPAKLPSAALLLFTRGGSSIHIKAEVTHGAGECTNEALSVMMGGSSSCWCNLLVQPLVVEGLLYVVQFVSDLFLVSCLNETVSRSYHRISSMKFFQPKPAILLVFLHLLYSHKTGSVFHLAFDCLDLSLFATVCVVYDLFVILVISFNFTVLAS